MIDFSKLKSFADIILNAPELMISICDRLEAVWIKKKNVGCNTLATASMLYEIR